MKRKPILLALALLLVVGAALWGVNYRLDHPPLTKADKEFRASVAGADSIKIERNTMQYSTGPVILLQPPEALLDARQTHQFIADLRFSNESNLDVHFMKSRTLTFLKGRKTLATMDIWQTQNSTKLEYMDPPNQISQIFEINPRFNKRLNRALDAYLPQRIRP